MPGVPRELAEHRLHVDPAARPVRERLRRSAAHKRKAIGEEVAQMAVLELDEYKKTVDPADLMRAKKPASESAFQSAGETKKVSIHPMDATAAPTNISTTLDPK